MHFWYYVWEDVYVCIVYLIFPIMWAQGKNIKKGFLWQEHKKGYIPLSVKDRIKITVQSINLKFQKKWDHMHETMHN